LAEAVTSSSLLAKPQATAAAAVVVSGAACGRLDRRISLEASRDAAIAKPTASRAVRRWAEELAAC